MSSSLIRPRSDAVVQAQIYSGRPCQCATFGGRSSTLVKGDYLLLVRLPTGEDARLVLPAEIASALFTVEKPAPEAVS